MTAPTYLDLFENKPAAPAQGGDGMTDAQPKEIRHSQKGIQEKILNVMHNRIGMHTTISEAQAELAALGVELSRQQVTNGLYQLSRRGLVKRLGSGGPYVYRAQEEDTVHPQMGHVFETIGTLVDGTPIVRSDEGVLFILEPLQRAK